MSQFLTNSIYYVPLKSLGINFKQTLIRYTFLQYENMRRYIRIDLLRITLTQNITQWV